MKIALIGGTGFIGSYFLNRYHDQYVEIKMLVRKFDSKYKKFNNVVQIQGTLKDVRTIDSLIKGVDVVVHTGFDHFYNENIVGINSILSAIQKFKATKLVYLSSYVVYDLLSQDEISEETKYSELFDLYTKEKQEIEKIIESNTKDFCSVILQPSVVVGYMSHWSNFFFQAGKAKSLYLPMRGEGVCNFLYIDDAVQAIFNAVMISPKQLPSKCEFFILSADSCRWIDMYRLHNNLLIELKKPCSNFEILADDRGTFHRNFFKNLVLRLLYSKLGYLLLFSITKRVKSSIQKAKNINKSNIDTTQISKFELSGLTKLYHNGTAKVAISKANRILDFKPKFSLIEVSSKMKIEMLSQYENLSK